MRLFWLQNGKYESYKKTIKVENNCTFPVWPAILSGNVPDGFRNILQPGEKYSLKVPQDWEATVWGRFGCSSEGNESTRLVCESGDCGNLLRCEKAPDQNLQPYTRTIFDNRSLSVDVQMGYNLPMYVGFVNASWERFTCGSFHCTGLVADLCPKISQVKVNNKVIGCKCSDCDTYSGHCNPEEYNAAFYAACPSAVPFNPDFWCPDSKNYLFTFCPA
ncbi:hypothetical protein SUGI_0775730 [Cryptomeria japonica]|nr:hypothetical protein SUGI_0775730 [Cryptomeria japonica]